MPGKEGGGQKLGFYEHQGSHSWDISPELHLEEEKNFRKKKTNPTTLPQDGALLFISLRVKREGKTPWVCWGFFGGFFFYPQH